METLSAPAAVAPAAPAAPAAPVSMMIETPLDVAPAASRSSVPDMLEGDDQP
jgi:hypothetical protein